MPDRFPVIAILGGTGALGSGLARRWLKAGYKVILGSRTIAKAEEAARDLGLSIGRPAPAAMSNEDAAREADIAVLTVPFSHQAATLEAVKPALSGKILVDVTVPLMPPKVGTVQLPREGSAGARAQALLGDDVRVVSAFQNVAAHHLQSDRDIDCDVLVCGNDADARARVIELVEAAGMRGWPAGPIENAAAAEALTSVLIQINKANKCHAGIRISGVQNPAADAPGRMSLIALPGLPLVEAGDDLAALVDDGLKAAGETLRENDIIVIAQKIVSKAEGRIRDLREIVPSKEAGELARLTGKDPRFVDLVLSESGDIVRAAPGVLIVAHRLGHVYANAGIDQSNVGSPDGVENCLLLPADPNATAALLRAALERRHGVAPGIIINDSTGRAWRKGSVSIALGSAGITPLNIANGTPDLFGRILTNTEIATVDEIASAASILMGQAAEAAPVILVRGLRLEPSGEDASILNRTKEEDLFR
tara:strand:- start:14818 stop:16257 length:1440 start_codon:yes stop_codon:yes gene_type:complete